MPMQPSPIAETSKPFFPSLRFCIVSPFGSVSLISSLDSSAMEAGILILPIYCLFLSLLEKTDASTDPSDYPRVEEGEAPTMTNRTGDASPLPDRARQLRSELACKIALFMGSAENRATDVPGLTLHRRTAPTTPSSVTYQPSVAVVAQGRKRVDLGRTTFIYDDSRFLLTSVDLPVVSQVNQGECGGALSLLDAQARNACGPRASQPRGDSDA